MNTSADIPGSYARKVAKGLTWVTVTAICVRAIGIVSAIILARLLMPADFGLMAIAIAVIAFSQGLTTTGFDSALIQKQEKPEDFLNTAWTFELCRNLALALIIFVSAPLLAIFFNEPRATIILKVLSVTYVFQGFRNIGVVYFRKNLEFHKQFIYEMVPVVFYISIVIPMAYILRNVWALVWATLASQIVGCIMSYILHPHRPKLDFQKKKAAELFNFGKWILGSSIVVMIREQGVTMFIGKLMGMATLGFYNRAGVFSTVLFQQVSEIVWKVGYPVYSQLQLEPERLKRAYLKTLQLLTFIGLPMAGGLLVLSRDFVHLFLTDKWLPIVPLMQILCLQAMLEIVNTPASIVFQASGRPSINVKISLLGVIILALLVYPLSSRWGATGAVASIFLGVLVTSPIVWYAANKVVRCSPGEFLKPVAISLISMCAMVVAIVTMKAFQVVQAGFTGFFELILAGVLVYAGVIFLFEKYADYGVFQLLKERVAGFA